MQTTLYFMRHGEVYNPDGILYVRLPNFGLSERGKKEAQESAAFLKDKAVSLLYASPLLRAQETAEIMQKILNIATIHTDDYLLEVKSSYQGKKYSDLDSLQSQVYEKPLSPQDESLEQIATRMKKFVGKIVKEHPGKTIAVVSHGDPVMILYALLTNRELSVQSLKGHGDYTKHAQIYKFIDNNGQQTMESVFIPELSK